MKERLLLSVTLYRLSMVCRASDLVSFPDPFPIFFIRMRNKGGGGERKGSGDRANPSADPGSNAAVGVKYAISNHTTAAIPLYYISTAL